MCVSIKSVLWYFEICFSISKLQMGSCMSASNGLEHVLTEIEKDVELWKGAIKYHDTRQTFHLETMRNMMIQTCVLMHEIKRSRVNIYIRTVQRTYMYACISYSGGVYLNLNNSMNVCIIRCECVWEEKKLSR